MTNTIKSTKQLGQVVFLSIILCAVISFVGCDKSSQKETKAPPTTTPETKTSDKLTQDKYEGILPDRIAKEKDVFALLALKQAYERGEEWSDAAALAFTGLLEALTIDLKPRTLIEGIDYLAVNTRITGDEEYTFSFLLKTTADLDTNYHLTVQGFVFPSNASFLPEARRERLYALWSKIIREEPTSHWNQGEYHVIHLKAKTPLIPYNMRLNLHTIDERKKGAANVGAKLALDWQWAVLNEGALISKIEACKNPAELYALAPSGPKISASLARALEKKWGSLTANMKPQTLIEGLDFLAVDAKATANKDSTFSFLLRPTADLNTNYHLTVVGHVDESHRKHIKPAKPGASYTHWNLFLYNDPTSQWKSGEYRVAQLTVEGEIIPYDLGIILQTRNSRQIWTGNPGNRIQLGWQVALPE